MPSAIFVFKDDQFDFTGAVAVVVVIVVEEGGEGLKTGLDIGGRLSGVRYEPLAFGVEEEGEEE